MVEWIWNFIFGLREKKEGKAQRERNTGTPFSSSFVFEVLSGCLDTRTAKLKKDNVRCKYQISHMNSKIYKNTTRNKDDFNTNLIEFTELYSKLCS